MSPDVGALPLACPAACPGFLARGGVVVVVVVVVAVGVLTGSQCPVQDICQRIGASALQ